MPYNRLNRIYASMKQRCCYPKCPHYKYYGARGITVCKEWLDEEIVEEKIESDNMNNKVEIVNIKPTNMRRRPFDKFEFPINNNNENNKDNENNINIT
jgi:hypothetical protein